MASPRHTPKLHEIGLEIAATRAAARAKRERGEDSSREDALALELRAELAEAFTDARENPDRDPAPRVPRPARERAR